MFSCLPGRRNFLLGICSVHGVVTMQNNDVVSSTSRFPFPYMLKLVLQNFPLSPPNLDEIVSQGQLRCDGQTRRTHRNLCCPISLWNHLNDGSKAPIPNALGIR